MEVVRQRLIIVKETDLQPYVAQARSACPDPDDAPYFAAALLLDVPLWSNDKALQRRDRVRVLSTHDLLALLQETLR